MKAKNVAYFFLRLTTGINFFAHGIVRIPKITDFRSWMVLEFQNSMIPSGSVFLWASILPYLEALIGTFLILGLFTFYSAFAGACLIVVLIFGSCMIENWDWVNGQMIYALFFFFLISKVSNNIWCLDNILSIYFNRRIISTN